MSYDINADGNKVFYEPELEKEQYLKEFKVAFNGFIYVNAYDEDHALKTVQDMDLNDEINDFDVYEV